MRRISCLLVDDDLDDQDIFKYTLSKIDMEFEFRTANDGAEAIELLSEAGSAIPDYIFLDVNMPKVNGIECLRSLKSMNLKNNCSIYMYSTASDETIMEKARALGAVDFIVKPASQSELTSILTKIFKGHAN